MISLYYFETNENGIQIWSVASKRYHDMLKDFVIEQLEQRGCYEEIHLLQSGEPNINCQLLRQYFTDAHVISRHFPKTCPPRLTDIIPCFWDFLKSSVSYCSRYERQYWVSYSWFFCRLPLFSCGKYGFVIVKHCWSKCVGVGGGSMLSYFNADLLFDIYEAY